MMNPKLYRNDVKNGNKTTRYYTVMYDDLLYNLDNPNTELYFDVFTDTIEIEEDSREVREGGRDDRFFNINGRVKDDIYFTEHFSNHTIFSIINQKHSKNNKFVWTRSKRIVDKIEGLTPEKIKEREDLIAKILYHSKF